MKNEPTMDKKQRVKESMKIIQFVYQFGSSGHRPMHLYLALARSHHGLRRKFGDCELVPEPIRDSCCSQGIFLARV